MTASSKRKTFILPALGAVLAATLLAPAFSGCGEEDPAINLEEFDAGLTRQKPERTIITDIEEEPGTEKKRSGRLKGTLVEGVGRMRTKKFRLSYIRETFHDVSLGQRAVLDILTFTGPALGEVPPRLAPLDVKEIRLEALRMVQRPPPSSRIRILKDLEIFLVFKKAYDSLSQVDRLNLISRWKDKHGPDEPAAPEEKYFPLFWLRTNPIFWDRGGRFWWWAAHALMRDKGFRIMDDGRVHITLPDGKGMFHS